MCDLNHVNHLSPKFHIMKTEKGKKTKKKKDAQKKKKHISHLIVKCWNMLLKPTLKENSLWTSHWSLSSSFFRSGNVWEELRDDSLESESHVATATSSATFLLQDHCPQAGFMQVPSSFSHNTASIPAGRCKAEYEDRNTDRSCWNGLHPVAYSGVESLAGYLTSCTTSLSLV